MNAPTAPCLRCGSFVVLEEAPAPGVPLCKDCLDGTLVARHPVLTHPPALLRWTRIRPFTALGFALGCAFGWSLVRDVLAKPGTPSWGVAAAAALGVFIAVYAAFVGEVAALTWFYLPWNAPDLRRWKRVILERTGLERSDEAFALVLFAQRRVRVTDLRMPIEVGLLAVGDRSLAFVGERGSRVALDPGRISGTALELMMIFPPRRACRVDLAGGGQWFFAFLDGSGRANRERAEALRRALAPPQAQGPGGPGPISGA